jgi:hypothetical protein
VKRLHQAGQGMAEFLVIAGALAMALFYPYLQGESVATWLLRAMMSCLRARSFLLSIL